MRVVVRIVSLSRPARAASARNAPSCSPGFWGAGARQRSAIASAPASSGPSGTPCRAAGSSPKTESALYRPPTPGTPSTMARNPCALARSASTVPGSVMATKSSAGAWAAMAAWKAFGSVVEPDLLLTQKRVRADSAHSRKPRTASGCVESRIRSSRPSLPAAAPPSRSPKRWLNSSGARLEPPMPSTAARV